MMQSPVLHGMQLEWVTFNSLTGNLSSQRSGNNSKKSVHMQQEFGNASCVSFL